MGVGEPIYTVPGRAAVVRKARVLNRPTIRGNYFFNISTPIVDSFFFFLSPPLAVPVPLAADLCLLAF